MNRILNNLALLLLGIAAIASTSYAQKPELRVQTAYPWSVERMAFSPDGKILAASGGIAKLWDVASGIELRTLTGFVTHVDALAFSPDGNTLVTASGDGLIVREVMTGKVVQRLAPRDSFYGVHSVQQQHSLTEGRSPSSNSSGNFFAEQFASHR
jgi:WD40 repeat protein